MSFKIIVFIVPLKITPRYFKVLKLRVNDNLIEHLLEQ